MKTVYSKNELAAAIKSGETVRASGNLAGEIREKSEDGELSESDWTDILGYIVKIIMILLGGKGLTAKFLSGGDVIVGRK